MNNWYCIYTKARQEDTVCRKLGELSGMEFFNPKLLRKKVVRSAYKEVIEELFPCYVFLRFDALQYFHMVKYTRGVKRFVGDHAGKPFEVEQSLIDFIRTRIENGFIYLDSPRLNPGEKVRVVDGPFAGLNGVFLNETKASERVMILLSTIQYQAKVEVPKAAVAKA